MLHNALYVLRIMYGVMYQPYTPSISPLRPSQINRVPSLPLAYKHAVVQINGINPCAPLDEARSIVALHDGHRFRAAATHARKDDYTHTQYPHESR